MMKNFYIFDPKTKKRIEYTANTDEQADNIKREADNGSLVVLDLDSGEFLNKAGQAPMSASGAFVKGMKEGSSAGLATSEAEEDAAYSQHPIANIAGQIVGGIPLAIATGGAGGMALKSAGAAPKVIPAAIGITQGLLGPTVDKIRPDKEFSVEGTVPEMVAGALTPFIPLDKPVTAVFNKLTKKSVEPAKDVLQESLLRADKELMEQSSKIQSNTNQVISAKLNDKDKLMKEFQQIEADEIKRPTATLSIQEADKRLQRKKQIRENPLFSKNKEELTREAQDTSKLDEALVKKDIDSKKMQMSKDDLDRQYKESLVESLARRAIEKPQQTLSKEAFRLRGDESGSPLSIKNPESEDMLKGIGMSQNDVNALRGQYLAISNRPRVDIDPQILKQKGQAGPNQAIDLLKMDFRRRLSEHLSKYPEDKAYVANELKKLDSL